MLAFQHGKLGGLLLGLRHQCWWLNHSNQITIAGYNMWISLIIGIGFWYTYIFPSVHNFCLLRNFCLLWLTGDFTRPQATFAISSNEGNLFDGGRNLSMYLNVLLGWVCQSQGKAIFHQRASDLWVTLGLLVWKPSPSCEATVWQQNRGVAQPMLSYLESIYPYFPISLIFGLWPMQGFWPRHGHFDLSSKNGKTSGNAFQ